MIDDASSRPLGFDPEEIDTSMETRAARLKWVVVVDRALPVGLQVNAAVCVAAATGDRVAGLLGPDAVDADGGEHPGLPWVGCTVLGADATGFARVRERAGREPAVLVIDMPAIGQETRVYDDYVRMLAQTPAAETRPLAVGLVGPRKDVDRIVKKLSLL